MNTTELATFYASLASDNTPCLPEPAASIVDDWHESGNLE